jgi:AAA family ATP:ADP antiporter
MSDLYTKHQAPRLFAFIASGASIGTIAGSSATLVLAELVGTLNLMLIAAVILVAIVPIVGILYRLKATRMHTASDLTNSEAIVSGNPFAGFRDFVRNPYLLGIALFIFLYTSIGSFAWFEIKNLMEPFTRDERTQMWAAINLTINLLAIGTAVLATGRIATRFGLATTLALVPIAVTVGFLVVAVNPVLAVIIMTWVVLKAGNYSITRPGREMLYTLVSREERFKAKPVIDIVVYRGGDTLAGWSFTGLTMGLGLGLGAVAVVGALIAVVWAAVGIYLGRNYKQKSESINEEEAHGAT